MITYNKTIRIGLIGPGRVGKSAILKQYLKQQFLEEHCETIAERFSIEIQDPERLTLEIVDTPGYPAWPTQPFPVQYATNIHGYILVYAINSRKSFEQIHTVLERLNDILGTDTTPKIVIGNKRDLESQREVGVSDTMSSQMMNKLQHREVTARSYEDTVQIFKMMVKQIINYQKN